MRLPMRNVLFIANAVVLVLVVLFGVYLLKAAPPRPPATETEVTTQGQVHQILLSEIHLGDGVPLEATISVQWEIADVEAFLRRYANPEVYAAGVLQPKALEIASRVARTYANADAVFSTKRDEFLARLKEDWREGLGERGISITDVFVANLRVGAIAQDRVYQTRLAKVQLGDGVPLDLGITVRWRISDVPTFLRQFSDPDVYTTQVLQPKAHEIARMVANSFKDVDDVFTGKREQFIQFLKTSWLEKLGERGVLVKDVSISAVTFPEKFTRAMEAVAMRERDLEQIRQLSIVDAERAKAAEKRAAADGQLEIIRAQTAGKVAEIETAAEVQMREIALAKAETAAQVKERAAEADANSQKLLEEAEVEREAALASVEVEKIRSLKQLEVENQRAVQILAAEREQALAELCATNPAYATFLVNRELASKVQIAVLPLGTEAGVLRVYLNPRG